MLSFSRQINKSKNYKLHRKFFRSRRRNVLGSCGIIATEAVASKRQSVPKNSLLYEYVLRCFGVPNKMLECADLLRLISPKTVFTFMLSVVYCRRLTKKPE
jgi:hypothetical protein